MTPRVCGSCGSVESDDARFCSRCGHPFATGRQQNRRAVVSIVFCDVVGSTALGERLEPETLRGVQERYFATCAGALARHGGQVEKYIGDAVMCVFGLPAVHEDDALRAVRGALDLTSSIEALSEELRRELGVGLAVRIGIHTGEVFAGDHATGQALVTGDTVNTAARLEQAAPAGGILIGETTHRLVGDRVVAEAIPPIEAKGKTEPLRAWRVLALGRTRSEPARGSVLVGREAELTALRAALDEVVERDRARLVVVRGEAGIGKSRLVAELVAGAPARTLYGACASYGRGNTYRPIREMLELLRPDFAEQRLATLMRGRPGARESARRLAVVVGAATGTLSRGEAFDAVAELFIALSADQPLIAVFEDVHWAEPTLLDLIEFLGATVRAPVLMIATARNELFREHPELAAGAIELPPLTPRQAIELVALESRLSDADLRRVVVRGGGNPLFLEQLARTVEEGSEVVPLDIASLLAARLDRLEPQLRAVLEAACVVGREFRADAVEALLTPDECEALLPALVRLRNYEFIADGRTSATAPATGLSAVFVGARLHFRHALVRDAVASRMAKAQRATLHEQFAELLARRDGHDPVLVGHHFEVATRLRMELRPRDAPPPTAAAAAAALERAGFAALQRDDAPAAEGLLNRARSLIAPDAPQLADVEAALERSRAQIDGPRP